MRYKIKITLDNGRYCFIDEMKTEYEIRQLFKWYEHHTEFFNGTISMWDCEINEEVI